MKIICFPDESYFRVSLSRIGNSSWTRGHTFSNRKTFPGRGHSSRKEPLCNIWILFTQIESCQSNSREFLHKLRLKKCSLHLTSTRPEGIFHCRVIFLCKQCRCCTSWTSIPKVFSRFIHKLRLVSSWWYNWPAHGQPPDQVPLGVRVELRLWFLSLVFLHSTSAVIYVKPAESPHGRSEQFVLIVNERRSRGGAVGSCSVTHSFDCLLNCFLVLLRLELAGCSCWLHDL